MQPSLKSQYITEHNEIFWDKTSEVFSLSVEQRDIYHVRVEYKNSDVKILVPKAGCSTEIVTIELLKIFLRSKKLFIADALHLQYYRFPLLAWTFPVNLITWIGYQLETIKIIPFYFNAKCSRVGLNDYLVHPNIPIFQRQQLIKGLVQCPPTGYALILFLNRYFAIEVSKYFFDNLAPDSDFLQQVQPDLFTILQTFIRQWNTIAVEITGTVNPLYKTFSAEFLRRLYEWCVHNVYCKPNFN